MFFLTAPTKVEKDQQAHVWAFGGLKILWIYLS
jgi:hypothetical protein